METARALNQPNVEKPMKYVTEDGTVFESIEDAQAYEDEMRTLTDVWTVMETYLASEDGPDTDRKRALQRNVLRAWELWKFNNGSGQ